MGFLKKLVKVAVPTALGAAQGGPLGAFAGIIAGTQGEKVERQVKRQNEQIRQQQAERQKYMAEIFGTGNVSTIQQPRLGTTASSGFGSGFGQFLTDVGRNIVNPFANLFTSLSPFFGGGTPVQPAITTPTIMGPSETSFSGTTDAGVGTLINPLLNAGRGLIKSPFGNLALGTGAGALVGAITGPDGKTMRITRKMKSQARMVVNLTGGNLQAAAEILNIDVDTLVFILLKRFRNDGPVVTKAALRKTKSTIRRLHNMQDVLKSITPTATGRKRAPVRRSMSTTLIKN